MAHSDRLFDQRRAFVTAASAWIARAEGGVLDLVAVGALQFAE
jgi:hypothetical protein